MRAITLTSFSRARRVARPVAAMLLIAFISELVFPLAAYAIGGGPSQPEATGFSPASASDMVDPFSGDFNYNIPLLDVDGYPVNLAYASGITMEQDASWVGLGWMLNVGALNRSLRGLPDDFKGDKVTKEVSMKNNQTYGVNLNVSSELVGVDKEKMPKAEKDSLSFSRLGNLNAGLGVSWNNYSGMGFEMSLCPPISSAKAGGFKLTANLGINASSASGSTITPSFGVSTPLSKKLDDKSTQKTDYNLAAGFPINSTTGLTSMTVGYQSSREITRTNVVSNAGSASLGGTISFGYPFRVPRIGHNMFNTNFTMQASIGLANFGIHGHLRVTGYYSGQFLVQKVRNVEGFGYLHTHDAQDRDDVMLDFNREKDGSYSEHTPRLPVTNYTYDILNASGQGISGAYRPYRNDVGVIRDEKVRSISAGLNTPGMEFGATSAFHLGGNIELNVTNASSGPWMDQNNAYEPLKASRFDHGMYEPYYYKKLGEKNADHNPDFLHTTGYDMPVRINLTDKKQEARKEFQDPNGGITTFPQSLKRNGEARAKRNEPLFALEAAEAAHMLDKNIRAYQFVTAGDPVNKTLFEPGAYTDIPRNSHPLNHMSEYTAVNTSGVRYVYGIPAYNNTQQDVSFSVADAQDECRYSDLVQYDNGDNSTANGKGTDNYFERLTIPEYAHSYLLTAVLSHDYADLTANGPSDDDRGTYTKFNYSRISSFGWRSPYTTAARQAYYNPGIGADKLDDKASYSYGEKELWYLHSIETKNYIAVFITEDRHDGYSASGENGGRGTVRSKLLKRIELYVKSELLASTALKKAVPVKVVHFSYNYSLCKGVPSNGGGAGAGQIGKLTLTGVYFTYGNSTRAASRGYTFNYQRDGAGVYQNPDYANKAYDSWGSYKPVQGLATNADYPYAEQSKELADQYAEAWNLKTITLPSGGTITIDYEADDYGFVQDKKAMQMFRVIGSSNTKLDDALTITSVAESCGEGSRKKAMLYSESTVLNAGVACEPYRFMYVELSEPVASKEELKQQYFTTEEGNGIGNLYFRFFVKTRDDSDVKPSDYETVAGYIPEDDIEYGICATNAVNGKTRYAWIKVKPVDLGDYARPGNAHPVSRSAWNLLRSRYPRLAQARADYDPGESNPLAIFEEIGSSVYQMYQMMAGYNFTLRQRNLCRWFDAQKSLVRLYTPVFKKLGGGSRVKKVALNDQFATLANASSIYTNAEYGKEYFYHTVHQGREISSGVAAYEPMISGEESPFRQPLVKKTVTPFMGMGTDYLQEGLFGESFFPAASVGYRKVTIKSIRKNNARSTATGREEKEFYTFYDFPEKVKETEVEANRNKPGIISNFFRFASVDHLAVSQGYAIELNDMWGRPKAVKSYSEFADSVPQTSTEYFYKTDPENPRKLYNQVATIDNKGIVHPNTRVGVETDLIADMREDKTISAGGNLAVNLEAFVAFVPVVLPALFSSFAREGVVFRSAVVTKVINRSGLLDSVVVKDLGARKTTHNLALDAESGEVLVSRINNNFNDDVFQVNLPAYWMYPEMGHAYKRTGARYLLRDVLKNPGAYLGEGDEVGLGSYYGWVVSVAPALTVLSNTGIHYNISDMMEEEGITHIKVMRSGNHNKIMLPAASAVVKENPIKGNQLVWNQVVDANAKFYDDNWKIFCGCSNAAGQGYNPYTAGRKENYRLLRDYVFLSNRTQTRYNGNLNVRKDGIYTTFTPFWNYNGHVWVPDSNAWTYAAEGTIYSATGAQLESRDALNRYSAAQFAFNDRANVAVGQNAMYREIGFDSFEDYQFLSMGTCDESHFSFYRSFKSGVDGDVVGTKAGISISSDSHSGNHSLRIQDQNNYIKIRKVISPCR